MVLPSFQGPVLLPCVLSNAAGTVQLAGFFLWARAARCIGCSHHLRKACGLTWNWLRWGCLVPTRCCITLCQPGAGMEPVTRTGHEKAPHGTAQLWSNGEKNPGQGPRTQVLEGIQQLEPKCSDRASPQELLIPELCHAH